MKHDTHPPHSQYPVNPDFLALQASAAALQSCNPRQQALTEDTLALQLDLLAAQGGGNVPGLLSTHMRQLDALFSRAMTEATKDGAFDPGLVQLAMRAQKQCRTAIEVASVLMGAGLAASNLRALREAAEQLRLDVAIPQRACDPVDPDPLGTILGQIDDEHRRKNAPTE